MIRMLPILFILTAVAGCTVPVSTVSRPDSYYDSVSTNASPESLFSSDEAVLSDEAIGKILEYDYKPPALNRIALMPFGREVWSQWSEELSLATDQMRSETIHKAQLKATAEALSEVSSEIVTFLSGR